jgi:hypothetical protein
VKSRLKCSSSREANFSGGRSVKDSYMRNNLNDESAPASKARRWFIGSMANLGAGLAGSVILPATAIARIVSKGRPQYRHCF